ncbi:MAG: hypothetical protein WB608_11560 [Terracidiphilus sp.]
MNRPAQSPSQQLMILLSRLLLEPRNDIAVSNELRMKFEKLSHEEWEDLLQLAHSNHVVVRGLESLLILIGEDSARAEWAETALAAERARIHTAMTFLHEICNEFEKHEYDVTVIKSLDHWPDLGSDLDLYTNANPEDVSKLMRRAFHAQIAERSWGDRLACKWNFLIPGLPEAVEIHMGRLGQTGEQVVFAASLVNRARRALVGSYALPITSISDRLMISSMQRMYRHFYFRLCDVIDTACVSDAGAIDFEELRALAGSASIWKGMATYLVIVSDYVKHYRGSGLDLPEFVADSARFGGDEIYYGRGFLRVPIMPQSAGLYGAQLAGVLGRGQLHSGARLSLLPWLATAAAVRHKLTGSDKGIW